MLFLTTSCQKTDDIQQIQDVSTNSVYEHQLSMIRSLGFKRHPETFDKNYIPDLTFTIVR